MRAYALLKKEINTHLIRRTCIRLSVLILVGAFFFLEQYSYGLYFSNEIVIDDDTSSLPQEPDIDIQRSVNSKSANIAYVVWSDNSTGNGDIYFRRSLDNGDNFDRRKFVSKNNGSSISPQIATAGNGNNVYVVWSDNTTGNGDIYFRRSLDNGDNFEGRDRLDGNLTRSFNPDIETSGDANIYIVWHGLGSNNMRTEVFFRASGDGGLSFDKPVSLTKDSLRSSDTNLVSSQNDLYMVWVGEDSSPAEDGKVNLKRISEDFFERKQAIPKGS